MLLSHSKRLCISLVFIISASPLKAAPTVTSTPSALPDALQKAVPSCAQSCLRASLDERFAVACSGQEGIQCLCSRYSSMGESLGEVALGCMYLSCSKADIQNSADSAYGVCLGQKDAVMPTKTALTYVVTSAPSTTSTPSTKSAATNAQTITSTLQTPLSSIQSAIIDSISTFPSATSSASTTPAAAAMAAEAPPRMTPAQIAGLSVAAVAAFVMAIGLMALSVCLRRRRERRGVLDLDEKGQRQRSARFSHYVPMEDRPEPPSQFPMIPPTAVHKTRNPNTHPKTARPAQRLGVGTGNSSSDSSLPLSQIGVAISAELDSKPVNKKAPEAVPRQQTPANKPTQLNIPFRPVSAMTQDTVFEEDEAPSRRRSSMLLPTPPVPIPPIRALQPSRTMPTFTTTRPAGPTGRRSELFLDIPVRHERPQPKRIIAAAMPSNGSPQPPQPASRPRLAPPFQMTSTATSYESKATTASSRDASNAGDIIDYYFSSNLSQDDYTPKASPAHITRPKETPKTVQFKTKKSRSRSLSRTTSRTSTNIRDSGSSQTSFETVSPNDPTPEDEDEDKQLSSSDDNASANEKPHLSPVAESPISKLRYPKVPRASNQLVPRSPRSPPPRNHLGPSNPSSLLQKRNNALPPLLLESRPRLESPHRNPFTSPPRPAATKPTPRSHKRSNSTESWSTTPASKTGVERKSRVQSGVWGKSPVMYEEDVVRPLNVRRQRDEMAELNIGRDVDIDFDRDGLKSPVWVPRLTPRKKGEDLFLEVGWR
jgi:hypothetical protein